MKGLLRNNKNFDDSWVETKVNRAAGNFFHIFRVKKVDNFETALKLAMCILKYKVFINIHCLGTCGVE